MLSEKAMDFRPETNGILRIEQPLSQRPHLRLRAGTRSFARCFSAL
jgi:hypothetical protein